MVKITTLVLLIGLTANPVVIAGQRSAASVQQPFLFGVVPQQAASKLAKDWVPLLQQLSKQSGVELLFATAPSIPVFEKRLANGSYDFAYMNPYHFTVFSRAPGYRAIAKARDKQIRGIIVVRKDSPAQTLVDLSGQQIAFPAPLAFAATLLTSAHLNKYADDFSRHFVSSHDSVYRNVAAGRFAAGGGIIRTFNAIDSAVSEQLRVLWTSPPYTPHAIAVHPRVAASITSAFTEALVAVEGGEGSLLDSLKINGFENAFDAQWDDVRALNIDQR